MRAGLTLFLPTLQCATLSGLCFCLFPRSTNEVQALLAGIWQTAEFITLCARRNRGIHPGAHVGLHLVIWLGSAIDGGFLTTFMIGQSVCDDGYDYYCQNYNSNYLGLEEGLVALLYILA